MSTDQLTDRWTGGPSFARVALPPRRMDLLKQMSVALPFDPDEREQLELRMLDAPANRRALRDEIRKLPRTARRVLGFGFNRNQPLVAT